LPHVYGDDAAVRNQKAQELPTGSAIRNAVSEAGRAAFHGNVVAFHATDRICSRLLGPQRRRGEKNERQKRVRDRGKKSRAGRQSEAEDTAIAARELCSGVHPDLLEVLYY